MARAMELDFLFVVPRLFVYAALTAWSATFVGLCRTLLGGLVRLARRPPGTIT
jgi:hypothetical protein